MTKYTGFKEDFEFSFTGDLHDRATHIAWKTVNPLIKRLADVLPREEVNKIEGDLGWAIVQACERAFLFGIEFGKDPLPFILTTSAQADENVVANIDGGQQWQPAR